MLKKIEIVEREGIKIDEPTVIEGFPDVGLVGVIASSYLVDKLELVEVAHIESALFPPVMVLHKGILTEPVRMFSNGKIIVVTSEIAIPPKAIYDLADVLSDWFKEKKAKLVVSLSGIPVQNRMEIDTPSVYGVGNSEKWMNIFKKNDIEVMEEGFMAGIYALLLKGCLKRGIPAIAFLSQSFLNYPDPGAAASAILSLNKILKLDVDVKPLLEKADEIRVKARDLMKQAQGTMGAVRKPLEREIPIMYH
ncbi:MAG: proteasome assembly chaperone family protein [archaeon]|nr:proteasome assembly chaperone family protein [archaeon]MCP8306452.1 proteasome assembly chaperone family protein [archaeon]